MNIAERNYQIDEERENGATYVALAKKYGISSKNIRKICDMVVERTKLKSDVVYSLINSFADDTQFATKTYRILKNYGYETKERIVMLGDEDYNRFRGCGTKMTILIKQVIESIVSKDYKQMIGIR